MDAAIVPPSPEQIEATGMVCRMAGHARRSFRLELPHGGRRSTTRGTMAAVASRSRGQKIRPALTRCSPRLATTFTAVALWRTQKFHE